MVFWSWSPGHGLLIMVSWSWSFGHGRLVMVSWSWSSIFFYVGQSWQSGNTENVQCVCSVEFRGCTMNLFQQVSVVLLLVVLVAFSIIQEGQTKPPPWAKAHGKGKFDGDILMDDKMLQRLQNPNEKPDENHKTRNILKDANYLWPGGIVPYVFNENFNSYPHERNMILSAIGELHKVSCVRIRLRTTEPHYISFTRSPGCSSYVGNLQKAAQPVSIGDTCAFTGTILHELLHVLGFFHVSSRPDRDSYVTLFKNNVLPGYDHNFWKYTTDQVQDFGGPYDLGSLMQPPRNAWSKNALNTIQSRRGPEVVLGNADRMTEIDIGQVNSLYQCTHNQVCYQRLGLQEGSVTDSQLSASSFSGYSYPHQARLHLSANSKGSGAWCPGSPTYGQWLQIDFGSYKYLKGIATQGHVDPFSGDSWVTNYNLQFSYDGFYWYNYATWVPNGLTGTLDATSAQYAKLPVLISARYLRIIPTTWHNNMCLRVEVYGCNY